MQTLRQLFQGHACNFQQTRSPLLDRFQVCVSFPGAIPAYSAYIQFSFSLLLLILL